MATQYINRVTIPNGDVCYFQDTVSGFITTADIPEGSAASTTTPKMDGTATIGTEMAFARGDHIHPTDTSRAASSHTHGNISNSGDITATATIASGDRIVINDESASKITNSSITFGSGTTTFLANNGTWQTPSGAVTSVNGSTGAVTVTVPTKTSDLTNDSGYITSDSDQKLAVAAVTSGSTYYPIVGSGTTAATRQYDTTGFVYSGTNGTANGSNGNSQLTLGNSTASTSSNWKKGTVRLYGTTAYYADLVSGAPTGNRTLTLPNATGTLALTSDIPDVSGKIDTAGTGLSKSGTTLNHSNSITAQTTQALYPIKIDAQGHISAYGSAVSVPTKTSDLTNDSGFITTSDIPEGSAASTTTPKMDGTAAVGTELAFARGDHVHPTDTSRAASSHTHGNITNAGDITASATIASGDRIVINDESASKITNSSITFGSSTTTFLANNGTWQTPGNGISATYDSTNQRLIITF